MGKRKLTHDFRECLAQSHAASELPFWEHCYRQAFPDFVAMHDHRRDGTHQRFGVDRSVTLESSRQLLIDEKVRGRNKITWQVYKDIALEVMSDRDRKTPGWISKTLMCDYIAYAIAPLGKCYLLPTTILQAAWLRCGQTWMRQFGLREARNKGWVTLFCPVPEEALFPEIGKGLRLTFEPVDCVEDQQQLRVISPPAIKPAPPEVDPKYLAKPKDAQRLLFDMYPHPE